MENSGGNMCRCCASEGVYKDLNTTYHWMGEEEVYGDMLKDCFNVQLSVPESSDGGICEVCITQLRNAINFKKQVLLTEEQFKKHVQKVFKTSIVKVEALADDDSTDGNVTDDGLSEPEFDEVPIKTEHVAETVTVEDEIKPKKRAAPIKASTSRTKKSKSSDAESPKKRGQGINEPKINRPVSADAKNKPNYKSNTRNCEEMKKHKHNITEILKCSNATPLVRHLGTGFVCGYCSVQFPDPGNLKRHCLEKHPNRTEAILCPGYRNLSKEYYVKLDITNLKCSLCDNNMDSLKQLMSHLTQTHSMVIHTDIKNRIVPFKFEDDKLCCCICRNEYAKFKLLQEHMHSHYRNYVCDTCDAGFVNEGSLSRHVQTHRIGIFACERCEKVYDTMAKLKNHLRSVHVMKYQTHRCGYCYKVFSSYESKIEHLSAEHGVVSAKYPCQACDRTFVNSRQLRVHIKKFHMLDRPHKCTHCEKTFFSNWAMKSHAQTHCPIKIECNVCHKMYANAKTLKTHMRLHKDRYKCDFCSKSFAMKGALKKHLQIIHDI